MKLQDIVFLILLAVVIWQRRPRLAVAVGLLCLFLSMPLFYFWVFFTAERLTWYAAAFFGLAVVLPIVKKLKS